MNKNWTQNQQKIIYEVRYLKLGEKNLDIILSFQNKKRATRVTVQKWEISVENGQIIVQKEHLILIVQLNWLINVDFDCIPSICCWSFALQAYLFFFIALICFSCHIVYNNRLSDIAFVYIYEKLFFVQRELCALWEWEYILN